MNKPQRVLDRYALPLILVVAIALRLPGLGWGLPHLYHPDEPTHVGIVLNILKTGDYNPHWFKYPSFRVYVSVPVAIAYFLWGVSQGKYTSVKDLNPGQIIMTGVGTTDAPGMYYSLRLLVLLFGILGVAFAYHWARKHLNERVALWTALCLAVSPVGVLVSHWYRPDTILMLFSGAAVFAAVQLHRRDHIREYIICGVCIGLASSVKYNAAALQFIPVLLAHFAARRRLLDVRLGLTLGIALAVFLVITPYALLDLPAFLDGFAFEINHYYVRGHPGADVLSGPLGNLLWYGGKLVWYEGLIVVLAVAAPFVVPKPRRTETALLLAWPAIVLVLDASAKVHTVLALVPVYLVLYTLAAIALDALLARARSRVAWANRGSVLLGCAILILGPPVAQTVRTVSMFVRPDVRSVTQDWIDSNMPADARLGLEAYGPTLQRPGTFYSFRLIAHPLEWYQAAGVEYLVASHYSGIVSTPEQYPQEAAQYDRLLSLPVVATLIGPRQELYDPMTTYLVVQVPLAERYELKMAEQQAPWLESGFYEPEWIGDRSWRWTDGKARLRLLLEPGAEYSMRLRGKSGRPTGIPAGVTVLALDGARLGEHTWSDTPDEWSVRFRASGEPRPRGRLQELVLETNAWRPSDRPGNKDARTLGALLESIIVEKLSR